MYPPWTLTPTSQLQLRENSVSSIKINYASSTHPHQTYQPFPFPTPVKHLQPLNFHPNLRNGNVAILISQSHPPRCWGWWEEFPWREWSTKWRRYLGHAQLTNLPRGPWKDIGWMVGHVTVTNRTMLLSSEGLVKHGLKSFFVLFFEMTFRPTSSHGKPFNFVQKPLKGTFPWNNRPSLRRKLEESWSWSWSSKIGMPVGTMPKERNRPTWKPEILSGKHMVKISRKWGYTK